MVTGVMSASRKRAFVDTDVARYIGFFFMVVGMFMATLDIQVVSSSLTEIQSGIGAGADEIAWVQTAYLVAEVVMVPLSAWLTDVFSTRWLFVLSCGSFTLLSFACATAWDTPSMILFRALQGFLGGAMIPISYSAVYKLFPPNQQSFALLVVGLVGTMAPALGPTVGGWLTDHYSWPWLFLVNIVPGILAVLVVGYLIRIDKPNWGLIRSIDLPGIVLVGTGLGSLQIVLERGPREDWFDANYIVFFTWAAVISLVLFLWRELSIDKPVVELRVFLDRNLTVGACFSFLIGIMFYGQSYALPLILASIAGYDSLQIGQTLGVTGGGMFIGAALAFTLGRRFDMRIVLALGVFMCGIGYWMNGFMTPEVGFDQLFWPQLIRGIALTVLAYPVSELCLCSLPPELLGHGSAVFNLFRNGGGAVGIALISVIFNDQENRDYWQLRGRLTPDRLGLTGLHTQLQGLYDTRLADHALASAAALKQISQMALRTAIVMGWNDSFQFLAIGIFVTIIFVPLMRRPKPGALVIHVH